MELLISTITVLLVFQNIILAYELTRMNAQLYKMNNTLEGIAAMSDNSSELVEINETLQDIKYNRI